MDDLERGVRSRFGENADNADESDPNGNQTATISEKVGQGR
jgi:hypothetical protein